MLAADYFHSFVGPLPRRKTVVHPVQVQLNLLLVDSVVTSLLGAAFFFRLYGIIADAILLLG